MNSDFEINQNDLDGEWLRQAQLYDDYARAYARAVKERDGIHLDRKITMARLYKEAKDKLAKAGGKDPTAVSIEAEVRTTAEYEEISRRLINADETVHIAEANKWAMVDKRVSLEQLCRDRETGFFMPSGVVAGKDGQVASSRSEREQTDKELRRGLNRGRINRGA
jgi:hypothetical protein